MEKELSRSEIEDLIISYQLYDKNKFVNFIGKKIAEHSNDDNALSAMDYLRAFAKYANDAGVVELYVAENILTPPDALMKLSANEDRNVVNAVARHPFTPEETLVELSLRKDPVINANLIYNPSLPVETIHYLSEEKDGLMAFFANQVRDRNMEFFDAFYERIRERSAVSQNDDIVVRFNRPNIETKASFMFQTGLPLIAYASRPKEESGVGKENGHRTLETYYPNGNLRSVCNETEEGIPIGRRETYDPVYGQLIKVEEKLRPLEWVYFPAGSANEGYTVEWAFRYNKETNKAEKYLKSYAEYGRVMTVGYDKMEVIQIEKPLLKLEFDNSNRIVKAEKYNYGNLFQRIFVGETVEPKIETLSEREVQKVINKALEKGRIPEGRTVETDHPHLTGVLENKDIRRQAYMKHLFDEISVDVWGVDKDELQQARQEEKTLIPEDRYVRNEKAMADLLGKEFDENKARKDFRIMSSDLGRKREDSLKEQPTQRRHKEVRSSLANEVKEKLGEANLSRKKVDFSFRKEQEQSIGRKAKL